MNDPYETIRSGWDSRMYSSLRRFLRAVAEHSDGASLLELDGVSASIAPATPDRSLFNSVLYEHPLAFEQAYAQLEQAYSEAAVRAWTVWVPEADGARAGFLTGNGHAIDAEPRAMAFDLEAMPEPDDELAFTRDADWRALCAINDAAYSLPSGSFESGMGSKPDPAFNAYGAEHQGWMASTLATLDHEGDCGVYLVATLPEARGHRYAGRLLHRALIDARERGCETATLQASGSGARSYQRLGFRDLGSLQMWERRTRAAG